MVLFKEDWLKEEHYGSIIDTKTRNTSFLRMAGLLKKMGVKNHAFLLVLLNPALQGVDPYDENLSNETKLAIAKEVKDNPWYFFREVFRVPPPSGNEPIMLKANRANIATIWLAFNHITTFLIQPRQTGKSLIGNGIDGYTLNIGSSNSDILILTKDDKLRTKTAKDIKELIELLPPYLQLMGKKDIKNTEKLTNKALKNMITIYVGQKDKKAADNLGRGTTNPFIRIDEFAYIYNIQITLPVLLASSTAAREVAEKTNSMFYTMFTTTPGKLNSQDGRFAHSVYNQSLRFNEAYYDLKDNEELNKLLEKNSKVFKVMLVEYNHRQLGFDDKWLSERLSAALSSGENAESDFFNKWINGNSSRVISKNLLDIIIASKRTKYNPYISDQGYVIRWYVDNIKLRELKNNNFLVIGLDTSEGLGDENDGIGLVIRDSRTGAVVGAGTYNETNLSLFSEFLVELLEEFPKSVLIPERRSSATAILDNMFRIMLVKRMNPFKRIFNLIIHNGTQDEISEAMKQPTMEFLNKMKRKFGFATSGGGEMARSNLYGNIFRTSVTYTADKVYDPTLIDQLSSLVIRNDKIDHDVGGHDDMVIAWNLGMFFLLRAKNKSYYGLRDDNVLTDIIDNEILSRNPDVDKETIKEQALLKEQISNLINKLSKVDNITLGMKIVSKIKFLESKINKKIIANLNIEAILKNIKMYRRIENRKKKKR